MLSVCRLSVTRVYCGKTTANRITRFSLQNTVSVKTKFEGVPSIGGGCSIYVVVAQDFAKLYLLQVIYLQITSHYLRTARANDRLAVYVRYFIRYYIRILL